MLKNETHEERKMGMSKRLEDIKNRYMEFEYDFNLRKEDIDWLINRVEELEKQRNERTQLLNAEVAKNVRYKKVLEKVVNHAGKGIDTDYELWKMAKRALEDEE